jgi:hypothetical protein
MMQSTMDGEVCVRACVRACVRVCVRACVRVRIRCVRDFHAFVHDAVYHTRRGVCVCVGARVLAFVCVIYMYLHKMQSL